MGRRALPKLDPALDLSVHLLEWAALPQPWNPERLFVHPAPLELEIGSGKGLFLSAAASQTPDVNFLGIEVAGKYARYAAGRLARQKLANARLLHGDAQRFLAEVATPGSLQAVHLYFPDPWWKARHRKRRVLNPASARNVERALAAGGTLHFWTDVAEYYESGLEILAAATQLSGPHAVGERPALHDLDYRTHFERRMRLHGLSVHRAEFRKLA